MDSIEGLGFFFFQVNQLSSYDSEACALEPAQDLTDEPSCYSLWLDNGETPLNAHFLSGPPLPFGR